MTDRKLPTDEELDLLLARLQREAGAHVDWRQLDGEAFDAEAAAALYALARVERFEAMPADLAERLAERADRGHVVPVASISVPPRPSQAAAVRPPAAWWRSLGLAWGLAACASLVAAVLGLRLFTLAPQNAVSPLSIETAAARTIAIQPGPDATGAQVKGEVIWNEREGSGYLRLAGLPVNDAAREQYQLWIFDATRDERYPVDGGVFDITQPGEARIAIHAPVRVRQAALFAVTLEKAGGVVVSDRGRIVAIAKPG